MTYRRERPKIRKILEGLMDDYGWSVKELYDFTRYEYDDPDSTVPFCLSSSMRIQLRKMIEDEE